jgi:hypothetical protein
MLITMEEFRDRYIARLRSASPDLVIQIMGANEVRIGPAEAYSTAFLNNIYVQYSDDPDRLDLFLDRMTASSLAILAGPKPSPDALVLVARSRATGSGRIGTGLAGDVSLYLAADTPTSLCYITPKNLEEWGLTEETAFGAARTILRSGIGPLVEEEIEGHRVFHIRAKSGLATGALALPDLWGHGHARRAVFVDTAWMFFWANAEDAGAMESLRTYARRRMQTFDTVSKTLIEFDGSTWREVGL